MKNPAVFVEDISFPDMLYAVTLRSPVACGVLQAIECPELPPSCYLVTAEHIPGKNELADFPVPVLADKVLSYIGEPVAILVGPDESKLEELARRTNVSAEEAAPVFSQDDNCDNTESLVKRDIVSGDADSVFQTCEHIVTGTYTTGIQAHWYPEPHGAAAFCAGGGIMVYTATQWPNHVRRSVEQVLGWGDGRAKVSATPAAAHLDGKLWYPSLVACHAALAACVSGKPVKLMLTGEEDFLYAPKRNAAKIEVRSALGEKGELLCTALRLTLDLGAQGVFKDEIIDHSCLGSLGLYRHPAFKIEAEGIRTNIPVQGPLAGFGLAQGFFAAECHASRIADALGQDPAEWRKNNVLGEKQNLAIGTTPKNSVPLPELIDTAAALSGYYRKWAAYELLRNSRRGKSWDFTSEPLRGIGIAAACQGNGFLHNEESGGNNCTVEMRLEKDGSLEIKSSFALNGETPQDIWLNLARDILGVEAELVRLIYAAPEAPDSGAAALSRNISIVTKLVEKCCTAIRNQRFRRPLPISVKRSAKSAKEPAWGGEKNIESEAFARPGRGAAVAEIEIDPVSLSPVIRGIWLAVDGGKILSPHRARGTLRTAVIQALGWTCREHLFYREGRISPELFRSYDIITALKVPPIHVELVKNDSSEPRGIGDLPFSCVPAAYVQAVSQAMDHHFEKIPLGEREIWDAQQLKQQQKLQEFPA